MKRTFQLSIIAAALIAASGAYAAPVWEGPTGTGTGFDNSMGGQTLYANVPSTANGVILGQLTDVDNTSVGIGWNSNALGTNSFAAGTNNEASGNSSIAISAEAHARGESSIAVGSWINANETNSTAVGTGINVNKASSVAVGNSQNVYDENATAVGGHSEVRGNQSSSLGDWAWASGGDGATAIGSQTWANAKHATTLGYNAETGSENALNIGAEAHGDGLNSIHIGFNTLGAAEDTIVLGSSSAATRGWADDKNSVAIGYGADTHNGGTGDFDDTVSFGGLFSGAVRKVTQVADGINDQDAINVSQLNSAITNIGAGAQLIAHADTLLTTEKAERIAGDATLQSNIDNEATLRANADTAQTAARTVAINTERDARIAGDATFQPQIDNEATLRANADVAQTAARTAAINTEKDARIAGDAATTAARIAAINTEKDARIAGDAATTAARIAAVNAERDARIAGDTALGQRIDLEAATRTAEVKRLDGRIDQASRRLDDIEKSAYRGVAIALAAQQAVPNIRSGEIALFAGVGHYEGETAGSVGVVTSFIANRVSLSGAVGFAGGNEVGGRIGLSYSF